MITKNKEEEKESSSSKKLQSYFDSLKEPHCLKIERKSFLELSKNFSTVQIELALENKAQREQAILQSKHLGDQKQKQILATIQEAYDNQEYFGVRKRNSEHKIKNLSNVTLIANKK